MSHEAEPDFVVVDVTGDADSGSGPHEPADENGPTADPSRWVIVAVAAGLALAVGVLIGFVAGRHRATNGDRASSVPASASFATTSVVALITDSVEATGQLCGVQTGPRRLVLGVQVITHREGTVRLQAVIADLPLGGLRLVSSGVGFACGQLQPLQELNGYVLAPERPSWLIATFEVLTDECPRPLPVNLTVSVQDGDLHDVRLTGFGDLGEVSLSSC